MKNKMTDLNDHLFAQIERLSNENLKDDELKVEIERSKAVTSVAREICTGAALQLKATIALHEGQIPIVPAMIGVDKK